MELKVVNEKDDKVFNRKIINADLTFEGTVPSRGKVLELATSKLNAKGAAVVVRSISPAYGGGKAKVEIAVYDDASKISEVELGHVLKRTEKTKGKTGAEDAKEAAAQEKAAPAEAAEEAPSGEKAEAAESPAEESAEEEKSE